MSKFTRLLVLVVGLIAVLSAMTASAGASTWTNTGNTSLSATTGASTLTANGVSLTCTSGAMTGSAPAIAAGPTYVATGTSVYNGCRLGGGGVSRSCTWVFTGSSLTGPVPFRVSGTFAVSCTVTGGCVISGTVTVTYTNWFPGITTGRFTILPNRSLVVSGAGCLLGSGAASKTEEIWNFISSIPSRLGGMILRQP